MRILLTFGMHGREYMSSEIALSFLSQLCRKSSRTEALLQHAAFKILPLINPSGRSFVTVKQRSCAEQRKNARGVDINRNFDVQFEDGSASHMTEDYRGSAAFSEVETQLVR